MIVISHNILKHKIRYFPNFYNFFVRSILQYITLVIDIKM